jgi:hypothetical protein
VALPPDLTRLAELHRVRQQRIAAATLAVSRREWRKLDRGNLVTSWLNVVGPALLAWLVRAQVEAARGAQDYVAAAVTLQGATPDPAGQVAAAALAGVASDGRPLDTLLRQALGTVFETIPAAGTDAALLAGQRALERMIVTQVQDTARGATGVGIVNDRRTRGYVRMVVGRTCARCIILAGRWYAANNGFARHPRCDCVHMPAAEVIEPEDPRQLFGSMSKDEQDRAFTAEGAQAIRDGADINQVVNARRGMQTAGVHGRQVRITTEGATRRGPLRLMPEQIYTDAGGDRDEAIRLLRRFGYIL